MWERDIIAVFRARPPIEFSGETPSNKTHHFGEKEDKRMAGTKGVRIPRLEHYRKQAGLSQEELASRAKVGVATIRRIEHGANARYMTLGRLARALQIDRKILVQEGAEGKSTEGNKGDTQR